MKLATELSRRGTGKTLYILDEPSIGLRQRDNDRLLRTLAGLRDPDGRIPDSRILAAMSGGIASSVIGAFYYLKIVKTMYFDEPAAGLSAEEIRRLGTLVFEIAKNGTVVLLVE